MITLNVKAVFALTGKPVRKLPIRLERSTA
jgi:CO/xanthine dehydrogenase Mo-binding subunit